MQVPTLAGWTFSSSSLVRARQGHILLNPSIDLGNPCNLNCPYCFIEEKNSKRKVRKLHELREEEIRSVLEDFLLSGAETVNLVGAGEPTIDPQFGSVVHQIFAGGARTVLFTNGVAIARDEAFAVALREQNVTVVLKFNSRSAEIQDAVVGKRGYTEERNRALQRLIALGFNATCPTSLGLDTLAFLGNVTELPDIHRWCRENNICPLTAEFIPSGRTADGTIDSVASLRLVEAILAERAMEALKPLSPAQREWLRSSIVEIDREYGYDHDGAKAYFGGGACTQLLGVYVDIEGRIWPCVARSTGDFGDRAPLGWIRKGDTASGVWRNSPYLRRLREDYDGACPYKAPLISSARGTADGSTWSGRDPITGARRSELGAGGESELVQIGSRFRG